MDATPYILEIKSINVRVRVYIQGMNFLRYGHKCKMTILLHERSSCLQTAGIIIVINIVCMLIVNTISQHLLPSVYSPSPGWDQY